MFNGDIRKLEKRIERLEQANKKKQGQGGIKVLLDFNRNGENNLDKVFLLTTIPPISQWNVKH